MGVGGGGFWRDYTSMFGSRGLRCSVDRNDETMLNDLPLVYLCVFCFDDEDEQL